MKKLITREQLYYLGIKAIIQNNNEQVLLLKHFKRYWDFPGGRVFPGEDVNTTLVREVFEETGLINLDNVKPDSMVLTPVKIIENNSKYFGLILWYHTCRLQTDQTIILSDEHTEYSWVEAHKVKTMMPIKDLVAPHIFQ